MKHGDRGKPYVVNDNISERQIILVDEWRYDASYDDFFSGVYSNQLNSYASRSIQGAISKSRNKKATTHMSDDGLGCNEYAILKGEPYLTKDSVGRYVILQEETIFSAAKRGEGIDQCYTTEALVNPEPSDKEIFEFKLRGAVKKAAFKFGK